MSRPAEPLSPRALSAFHDACIEEINQRHEHWGGICLLGTHTGLRSRMIAHYTEDWRVESSGPTATRFKLPKGQVACTLEEGGCHHCHLDQYSGDDGFFRVKKNTVGEGRTIPVWEEWMDYYKNESRPTKLPEVLDHYFQFNDSFGMTPDNLSRIVKKVAMRRHDIIATHHEGEKEVWMGNNRVVAPDIKMHDTRATWATQCLRAGIDPEQIMDWAGWKSRGMVDRYRNRLEDVSGANTKKYAKGRDGDGMSAADKIEKLQDLGLIDDSQKMTPEELAAVEDLL